MNKNRITADEAFAAYVAMASGRSLPKLRVRYEADPVVHTPSMAALKKLSARDNWQSRAAEHDRQVEAEAPVRLHEAKVSERVDTALDFHKGSTEALAWVMSLQDKVKVETAADVVILANVAIGLGQQALEIERGSPPPWMP